MSKSEIKQQQKSQIVNQNMLQVPTLNQNLVSFRNSILSNLSSGARIDSIQRFETLKSSGRIVSTKRRLVTKNIQFSM